MPHYKFFPQNLRISRKIGNFSCVYMWRHLIEELLAVSEKTAIGNGK